MVIDDGRVTSDLRYVIRIAMPFGFLQGFIMMYWDFE